MPQDMKKKQLGSVKLNFFGEQNDKIYTGSKFGLCLSVFSISMTFIYFLNVIK